MDWICTNAAGFLPKKYIQRPVQAVFDSAIVASGARETFDAERQATHVTIGFQWLTALDGATTDEHPDGLRGAPATECGRYFR